MDWAEKRFIEEINRSKTENNIYTFDDILHNQKFDPFERALKYYKKHKSIWCYDIVDASGIKIFCSMGKPINKNIEYFNRVGMSASSSQYTEEQFLNDQWPMDNE